MYERGMVGGRRRGIVHTCCGSQAQERHTGVVLDIPQPEDIRQYVITFENYHRSMCCLKHKLMNWSARVLRECKGDFAGQRRHANVAALLLAPSVVPKYF
jgi:hypothetical protein